MKFLQVARAAVVLRSLPISLLVFLLMLYALLRVALLVYTGTDLVPVSSWPLVLLKGLWFDLVVSVTLVAPVLLYEALLPNRWRSSAWHQKLRNVWLFASLFVLLFGAVSEFTFWIEFSTRLNFIALDYLLYTSEVIRNIRESYPVGWILTAIALLALLLVRFLHQWLRVGSVIFLHWRERLGLAAVAVAMPAILLAVANVEQMDGKVSAYADELSGNGLFTLAAAARRNELDYLKFYRTLPDELLQKTLAGLDVSRPVTAALRPVNLEIHGNRPSRMLSSHFTRLPKNIVLVSIESLSASFVGSYGGTKGLTPQLDALSKEGLLFEQVYATGTRTVRGLEALSLGTPPVPGQAIVRRPANEHLTTLGEVLAHQEVDTFFFYGGYGYFDNMNAYFGANDYRVIDRTDIPSDRIVFENVWGVADEVLFNAVIDSIDRREKASRPFFAHVMTTSNHRPYTYPDGRIDIPSPGGREGAVKYTDYAIGKFIRDAKTRPWFADTLFVFVADHCASVAGKTKLPVRNYRIPLVLYSPGNLKPGVFAAMISQIDLAPSLIDALGRPGSRLFYGRSVFTDGPWSERAFISNYQELGYLKNNKLTVLLPKRRVQAFDVDPETLESMPSAIDEKLLEEAITYYQSASVDFRSGALRATFHEYPRGAR
ncbi:MAG: alkaline phosphatase family protein [Oxalobacteraceae bacterium]|jgi:phosphoglycerol transferase MdoB-like AlkP superfamily enzyme|nr:alkaline phosphatase family protein [Oxalobacteraceae bacterium]